MGKSRRGLQRRAGWTLSVVLLLGLAPPLVLELAHSARWRVPDGQRALVERTVREGAAQFGATPEQYLRLTSPSWTRLADRTCVTLASRFDHGGGTFHACYGNRTGEVLEMRAAAPSFGAQTLGDRYRRIVLRL
jgi:hypothetical protein